MKKFTLMSLVLAVAATRTTYAGIRWEPLREPGCGGWIVDLAASPHDPRRLVVSGDMLGAGVSTDGGEHWVPSSGLASYEMGAVTFHPADPAIVWIGSMSGPVLSTDGGRTFTPCREGFPAQEKATYSAPVERVLFDPNDARRLLAFGGSSRSWDSPPGARWGLVWESRDAGRTWTRIGAVAEGRNVHGMAFAAGSSDRLYAAVPGAGVAVSEDGGLTWNFRNSGLPHLQAKRLVAHPTLPDTLFVALDVAPGPEGEPCLPGGVWRSDDAGRTWQDRSGNLPRRRHKQTHFTSGGRGFAVSPTNPDLMVYAIGAWDHAAVWRTRDGGATWNKVLHRQGEGQPDDGAAGAQVLASAYPAGPGLTTLAFDPHEEDILYGAGSEYAVASHDGGTTWTDITAHRPDPANPAAWRGNGYSGLCCTSFTYHPTDPARAFLMAMDAGKLWQSRDGLRSWTFHGQEPWSWGGGNALAIAGDHLYATFGQHGNWGGIGVSHDGGATWKTLIGQEHGLPGRDARAEPKGIYAWPDEPSKVWATVGGKLLHSADAGATWKPVPLDDSVSQIAGDPSRPRRFFLTGSKGQWVTDDGAAFTSLGGPVSGGRSRCAVDAKGRLYVCAWRRSASEAGLWRFVDGAWTRLLDEPFAFDIAIDSTDPVRMALVTNDDPYHDATFASGVWVSVDDGAGWTQANEGLGMLRGQCVTFNPHDVEELVVGTFGGGFYRGRWPKAFRPAGTRHAPAAPTVERPATPAGLARVVVRNGGMTQGVNGVAGWQGGVRDTAVFKEGPASLRLDGKGTAVQRIDGLAGRRVRLAGWIRTRGSAKAQVAVQSFSEGWKNNQWQQLVYQQGDADWRFFDKEVTLPFWTAWSELKLYVEGDGQAWIDEVRDAAGEVDAGTPVTALDEMRRTAPAKGKPWEPAWCIYDWRPAWFGHHERFVARTKQGGIDVVAFGDSITMGWDNGVDQLVKAIDPALTAVNYGIGGDATRQVLWRIENGEVDGLAPKAVVLAIGTNNLYGDQNAGTDAEIAKGIEAVVRRLREKLPATKVLVVSILPRQNDFFCNRIRAINALTAKLDDGANVRVVDLWDAFHDAETGTPERRVKEALFNKDLLHLEAAGYAVWSEGLRPALEALLRAP